MANPYLSGVSFYSYGETGGNGSISINLGTDSQTYALDEEATYELRVLADRLVRRKRKEMINATEAINILPAISYADKTGAIDGQAGFDIEEQTSVSGGESVVAGDVDAEEAAAQEESAHWNYDRDPF